MISAGVQFADGTGNLAALGSINASRLLRLVQVNPLAKISASITYRPLCNVLEPAVLNFLQGLFSYLLMWNQVGSN